MKKIQNVRLKMLDYINENLYSDLYSKNKTKKSEYDENNDSYNNNNNNINEKKKIKDNEKLESLNFLLSNEDVNNYEINLFDVLTGFDISKQSKINITLLEIFVNEEIPKNKLLISNIFIKKKCFFPGKNNKISENNFDYYMEISNSNIKCLYALIVEKIKKYKIKIYILYKNNIKYVGKIESNFLRNNYILYLGTDKKDYKSNLKIHYDINFLGLFGPRAMNINFISNNTNFLNKKPIWSQEYNNYILNFFNHRVQVEDKKNFILENNENKNAFLQCGKISENLFALDFMQPFTPIQAFSICITSLLTKIPCE